MDKQKSFKWPERFSSAAWTGVGMQVAKGWTSVLAKDTGMKINIACTSDTVNRFKWLHYGIVNITGGGTAEVSQVLEGDRRYGNRDTGAFAVRAVWVGSKTNSGFMVRGDSYIKDIYDIKPGVKVVDMRSYLASQRIVEAFLAWAGIDDCEKEVNWVQAHSSDEKAQLVVDGKADVCFAVPSSPSIYKAEKNPYGIRWIDLNADKDPEGAKRFHKKELLIDFAPMFSGVQSCVGRWGSVGTGLLCCRADASIDLMYNLAKWLDENWTRYKDNHVWLEQVTRKNLMLELDKTFIPCHDGLIKYLKELKLWTDAHQKRHEENVKLVNRYCEASEKAMLMADEKEIWVSPENPEWVKLWEDYKKELGIPVCDMLPSLHKG